MDDLWYFLRVALKSRKLMNSVKEYIAFRAVPEELKLILIISHPSSGLRMGVTEIPIDHLTKRVYKINFITDYDVH